MVSRSQGSISSGKVSGGNKTLVSHVVDRKDGGDFAECRVLGVERAQHHRHQRGLPVVAVKDMRDAQNFGGFEHGAREQGEALGVVGIIARRRSHRALRDQNMADNPQNKIGLQRRFAPAVTTEQKRYLSSNGMVMLRTTVCGSVELGLTIARNVDAYLMSESGQCARQGADYVSQSASF